MSRPAKPASLARSLLGVALLFVAVSFVQKRIDAQTHPAGQPGGELLLASGTAIKRMGLGYDSLVADLYWTRTVQYYGSRLATKTAQFPLLWPLLDITTTLDPQLIAAYRFGSIFLSEPAPIGAGRTDLAIALDKRGIGANPNNWILGTDLGFLYYWRLKDYPNAAAAYLAASRVPGAPTWVNLMSARISAKGASTETSQMIWSQLYESTSDQTIRKIALDQLQILKAQLDETRLSDLAEQYRKKMGRYPSSTQDMLAAGLLHGIPVDPTGVPYAISAEGKAVLDPHSVLAAQMPSQPDTAANTK